MTEPLKGRWRVSKRKFVGGLFEAIQDGWPEEIVSVEAVAVERYEDLE